MSSDAAIRFDSVGKSYRIGSSGGGKYSYQSLGERLGGTLRNPLRAVTSRPASESFWALRDVSFDVAPGEVVGVIGRNGAGKSTLLKVLSQITKPTEGRITVRGRVGSLLEVGTGFHPELTGRENIYLNGAILGMTRREVKQKFDEIVAFSEVDRFLETPVKQYSSGMYTRLAFAVAAHLDPEVLVVDEVLAVGDAQFQKKCLGRMKDVAAGGRTVLFVSHNMGAVSTLCSRCILLANGQVEMVGDVGRVTAAYFRDAQSMASRVDFTKGPLKSARVESDNGLLTVVAEYETDVSIDLPKLGFVVHDEQGQPVFGCNPVMSDAERPATVSRAGEVTARIASPRLRDGEYTLSLWFGDTYRDLGDYPHALSVSVVGAEGASAMADLIPYRL